MAMITLECPHCGARLQVEPWRSDIYCDYCDSTFTRQPEDGVAAGNDTSVSAQLTRAFFFLEDGDFARADEYLEKVLDADPHCARAYMGKLLCKLKLRHMADLKMSAVLLTSYELYNRALRFANEKEAARWRALNDEVIERRRIAAENAARAAAQAKAEAEEQTRRAAEESQRRQQARQARFPYEQERWKQELADLQRDVDVTQMQYEQAVKTAKWPKKMSSLALIIYPFVCMLFLAPIITEVNKPLNGEYSTWSVILAFIFLSLLVLFFVGIVRLILSFFKPPKVRALARQVKKKKAHLMERSAAYRQWLAETNNELLGR